MTRLLLAIVFSLAAGCSSIGVARIQKEDWYATATRSILNSDDVSEVTRNILRRRSLLDRYRQEPVAIIFELHDELVRTRQRELCVAIAELGFLQTGRVNAIDRRALGTAVRYAYAYLFDPKLVPEPDRFDAQFRWACDLYNAAIAELIRLPRKEATETTGKRVFEWYGHSVPLVIGTNELAFDPREFAEILVAYDFRVEGLPAPDARRGFGVPCILRRTWNREEALKLESRKELRFLPPDLAFAATAVIRFAETESIIDPEPTSAIVDILNPMENTTVRIGNEDVPIETDFTTPIASALANKSQSIGIRALLSGQEFQKRGGLYMFQPYQHGRIPILLIHGLASDPLTWLPLYTDLVNNKVIRTRCQFMFWFYPTGQPVLASATELRNSLKEADELLDPDDADPAQNWMLLCGHSMGGVLSRSLVVSTGDSLWNASFKNPFESLDLDPRDRDLLARTFFFDPLPFVRRVIFYATPHRGSPDAKRGLVQWASGLISLPSRLVDPTAQLLRKAGPKFQVTRLTSFQSLQDNNPTLIALADLPIDSRVTYHNIIGDDKGADRTGGTDGIVPYSSSHVPGAASELVVHSGHSVQLTPEAARETERIILEHIARFDELHAKSD